MREIEMICSSIGLTATDGEISLCESIANDLLLGADKIAEFLFGDPAKRRKVYHLSEKTCLPVFRLGSVLCARKSTLVAWIEKQEGQL